MSARDEDSAWPLVLEWSRGAANEHRLVEADEAQGERTLASLDGVTEWSVLGALARHAAALAVEDWLLVLGAGGGGHPGLLEFNGGQDAIPGSLIVAADVVGGGFVVNGGTLGCGEPGEVCYLAPDDLEWMPCEMGHSAFVRWALEGGVGDFYDGLRWPGWQEQVAALAPGQGLSAYPPPFTREGRGPDAHRRAVPLLEAWGVVLSMSQQLRDGGAGNN